jgi:hypothetical protein
MEEKERPLVGKTRLSLVRGTVRLLRQGGRDTARTGRDHPICGENKGVTTANQARRRGSSHPPGGVFLSSSATGRKRLHAIAHICDSDGGCAGWWFWPRRHRLLGSYLGRMPSGLAWSCPRADEAAQ